MRRLTAAVEVLAARVSARSPVRAACLALQHGLMAACRRGTWEAWARGRIGTGMLYKRKLLTQGRDTDPGLPLNPPHPIALFPTLSSCSPVALFSTLTYSHPYGLIPRPMLILHSLTGQVFVEDAQIASWLQPLPKLIWELADLAPDTTALALRMLLDAARFTPCRPRCHCRVLPLEGLSASASAAEEEAEAPSPRPLRSALEQLQRQLAPLFCMHLPQSQPSKTPPPPQASATSSDCCPACARERGEAARLVAQARAASASSSVPGSPSGGAAAAASLIAPGPLSKLPLEVQLLAVDLMYHLSESAVPCSPCRPPPPCFFPLQHHAPAAPVIGHPPCCYVYCR